MQGSRFGNGSCIYTTSGGAAREFAARTHAGMVGINVGIPVPLSIFRHAHPLLERIRLGTLKEGVTEPTIPRRKKYLLIKSRQHFRAGFEPVARHIVMCDGEGVTGSDLRRFAYRNRPTPMVSLRARPRVRRPRSLTARRDHPGHFRRERNASNRGEVIQPRPHEGLGPLVRDERLFHPPRVLQTRRDVRRSGPRERRAARCSVDLIRAS
jgi:hypothetical protein